METNIYEFVLFELQRAKGRWTEVADGAGVPKRTLEKIARREIKTPSVQSIIALADYFKKAA